LSTLRQRPPPDRSWTYSFRGSPWLTSSRCFSDAPHEVADDFEAAEKRLRKTVRATFDQISIGRYLAVFGAVPRERPYRQWLSTGGFGNYVHIADVWADPESRQQILARLQRGPISWKKLAVYLKLDLEYLDLFAQQWVQLKSIPLIVRDLTDKQMLQFMGRENLEDYNADFLCMLETWEAAAKFAASIDAEKRPPLVIAQLLGWTDPRTDRDGAPMLNMTARACNAAHSLGLAT
jgi:hypothetical protein